MMSAESAALKICDILGWPRDCINTMIDCWNWDKEQLVIVDNYDKCSAGREQLDQIKQETGFELFQIEFVENSQEMTGLSLQFIKKK